MTTTETTLPSQQPQDNEQGWTTLVYGVWQIRGRILIALLAASLAYWVGWLGLQVINPKLISNNQVIRFTFQEAAEGMYPNGQPFAISDLVSPKVLARVYDVNNLAERGVREDAFAENFVIRPHVRNYDNIIGKYNNMMAKMRGLPSREMLRLQEEIRDEVQQITGQAALLSFYTSWRSPLQDYEIDKILLDIPRVWADIAIEDYGALALNTKMYTAALFDDRQFEKLDYYHAVNLLRDNINSLTESVQSLFEFPNSGIVTDDETGYSLADLERQIQVARQNHLSSLSVYTELRGLTRDKDNLIADQEYAIKRLSDEELRDKTRLESIKNAIANFRKMGGTAPDPSALDLLTAPGLDASGEGVVAGGMEAAGDVGPAAGFGRQVPGAFDSPATQRLVRRATGTPGVNVGLSATGIGRLVDMINPPDVAEHNRWLNRKLIEYQDAVGEARISMNRKDRFVEFLKSNDYEPPSQSVRVEFEEEFQSVLAELRRHTNVFLRLHAKVARDNFGVGSGALYRLENTPASSAKGPLSALVVGGYLLLLMGTFFVVAVVALTARSVRRYAQSQVA